MSFDPQSYGPEVAEILTVDQNGERLMPLVSGACSSQAVRSLLTGHRPANLFSGARSPEGAMAGLWLYFSCLDEAHQIVQELHTPEGSLWHGILHRQEPDSGNAAYWFRRVGSHPVFSPLCSAAREVTRRYPTAEFRTGGKWDSFAFVMFCERARKQPGSAQELAALEIQRAEWQLLFDYCARPKA